MLTCRTLLTALLAFTLYGLSANNITVTNVGLSSQNTTANTSVITFDLSWENSWRIAVGPSNWDAAWVFAKYRVGGGPWRHARLTGLPTGPGNASVDQAGTSGAFVYRAADGNGSVNFAGLALTWNYGADGIDDDALVDVQVFALKMVYVPEGEYRLGTGFGGIGAENENGEFRTAGAVFPSFYAAYPVTSEAAIVVGPALGQLYYDEAAGSTRPGDHLGPIPAAFPKGFAAFYCMKYEMSQSQYVAFFNTLTQTQREALDVTGPGGKNMDTELSRNGISWDGVGNATTTLPDLPLNYVNNATNLAYLDWAALRPMTELEFKKAGRGPATPVNNEFAWGSANIHATVYTLQNAGTPNERITDPGSGVGNAAYGLTAGIPSGPRRCGIMAASAISATRESPAAATTASWSCRATSTKDVSL